MPRQAVTTRWQELDGKSNPHHAAIVLGSEYGVSWSALLGHLCHLQLLDEPKRELLVGNRPRKVDYLEAGVSVQHDVAPPMVPPRYTQAVVRAFKRHKISKGRALDLLWGTILPEDLPVEDTIPRDSMVSQFDLP